MAWVLRRRCGPLPSALGASHLGNDRLGLGTTHQGLGARQDLQDQNACWHAGGGVWALMQAAPRHQPRGDWGLAGRPPLCHTGLSLLSRNGCL